MITKRNFLKLTDEENKIRNATVNKSELTLVEMINRPRSIIIHDSLFPNYCLHSYNLEYSSEEEAIITLFSELIKRPTSTERDVLNFIRDNYAYYIIGSILSKYSFGHHTSFLFPEFQLPPNYQCDYLIVGCNSHGYHFIFVELESINSNISLKDGEFGNSIRKGIKQTEDWKSWLDSNFHTLRLMFEKYLGPNKILPKEFISYDSTRIHLVVVGGLRDDFNDKTYQNSRKSKKENNINIIHYDNLIEDTMRILKYGNYV